MLAIFEHSEGQLFVGKTKDTVFSEPTLDVPVEHSVLEEWRSLSLTNSQWREKFEIVNQVVLKGENVEPSSFKEEEVKMESARDYKTPLKRRVRESLEEDDVETYNPLNFDDPLDADKFNEHFSKIDKALRLNQEEHQKFRNCQIELEDNFREISYASEFQTGLLSRKIGKCPKTMDVRFDGPDFYGVIGSVAEEVIDLQEKINLKTSGADLQKELKIAGAIISRDSYVCRL